MAVTYSDAVKTSRMTAVRDAIDVGTGAPTLQIRDSGNVVLATIPLDSTSCGTVSNPSAGVVELNFTMPQSDTSADATGTAHNAIIRNGDATPLTVISGLTVGTTGTDIILNSTSISSGQTVEITSAKIRHG